MLTMKPDKVAGRRGRLLEYIDKYRRNSRPELPYANVPEDVSIGEISLNTFLLKPMN